MPLETLREQITTPAVVRLLAVLELSAVLKVLAEFLWMILAKLFGGNLHLLALDRMVYLCPTPALNTLPRQGASEEIQ